MVISCKVYKQTAGGNERGVLVRIPDPKENLREALVALKRELHLPGDTELATEDAFTKAGYLYVVDMRNKRLNIFDRLKAKPRFQSRSEKGEVGKKLKRLSVKWLNRHRCRRPPLLASFRPIAIAEAMLA